MTKFESLKSLLAEKQNVSNVRGRVRESLFSILNDGKATTGMSSYGRGGWASKDIWTAQVSSILTKLGIKHECGNNAPRGGASGEFVKVTMPAFLKAQKEHKEKLIKAIKAEKDAKIANAKKKQNEIIAEISAMCGNEDIEEQLKCMIGKEQPSYFLEDVEHLSSNKARKISFLFAQKHNLQNYAILDLVRNYPLIKE